MLSLGRHCSTPIHTKTPQHPQSGGLHVPELPWPTIAIAPFSAIETLRPEGAKRFSDLMTGELTEFAWLLSPKPEDAWVRPAWPRGTTSGLEERRRRPAVARARPYLGCRACPRRARPREAPAAAGRPRRALGRPSAQRPSRPDSALPPSAAPVAPALRTRPGPRGVEPCRTGAPPGLFAPSRLGLPRRWRGPGREQAALGRALFLAGAALLVGQTEPVNSAVGEGPVGELPGKAAVALLKADPAHSCLSRREGGRTPVIPGGSLSPLKLCLGPKCTPREGS